MATTMRDVAQAAGVSIATVSFVVNNSKRVAPETRLRIERAMSELGFRRNMVGRALASRRTRIIALAYPALEHNLGASAMEFVTSAARTAGGAGYHLVLWPVSNDGAELTDLVGQGLVDGVLLMEVQLEDARVGVLTDTRIPFALIGRTADPGALAHVDIDFEQTMTEAVDHLLGHGHHELVLVTGSQTDASFDHYGPYVRLEAAYRRLATEHGFAPLVAECEHSASAGRDLAGRLSDVAPTATGILIMNEYAAPGLVNGLLRQGIRIPLDVSVLSLLTSVEMGAMTEPTLTLMSSPGVELGRLGVEALLRLLADDPALPPRLLPGVLHLGDSTGPAPRARRRPRPAP
jgi:DNA-binding LacI/PurR family transcriptional regulator